MCVVVVVVTADVVVMRGSTGSPLPGVGAVCVCVSVCARVVVAVVVAGIVVMRGAD